MDPDVVVYRNKKNIDKYYKLNTKKVNRLAWKSKISITEGIRRTGNWLIKNKHNFTKNNLNYHHKK